MIKYSNVMRISELCRADRITGRTNGRRNLKAERSAMRRLLAERAKQGKVEKVGRSGWRAIYFAFAAALLLLSVVADPAAAQHSTTFRNSLGQTTGTATKDSNGTVTFRDGSGRTTGTATTNVNSATQTTTFRDGSGRTTGTATRNNR
jgi:hypothetical protein